MDFTVGIPPDGGDYVADIFWRQTQWAELRWDGKEIRLTLFPQPTGEPWDIPYNEALSVLQRARQRLRQLSVGSDG